MSTFADYFTKIAETEKFFSHQSAVFCHILISAWSFLKAFYNEFEIFRKCQISVCERS